MLLTTFCVNVSTRIVRNTLTGWHWKRLKQRTIITTPNTQFLCTNFFSIRNIIWYANTEIVLWICSNVTWKLEMSGTLVYDDDWINKTRYLKKFEHFLLLLMLKMLLNECKDWRVTMMMRCRRFLFGKLLLDHKWREKFYIFFHWLIARLYDGSRLI